MIPDFADRARLTATGLKEIVRLADRWVLRDDEAAALVGVTATTWEQIKAGIDNDVLDQDQFTRVSLLIGIYKGLHLVFADSMADRWPGLENSNFGGRSAVAAMIEDGTQRMFEVRQYVDRMALNE